MFIKSKVEGDIECLTCSNAKINIASKGRSSIVQHITSERHQKNIRSASNCVQLTERFPIDNPTETDKIAAVEATLAYHTVYHHLSYNSADCSNRLVATLFQDSKIAPKVQCGKTKTQAVADNVLVRYSLEIAENALGDVSYIGVSTDGSNFGNQKLFPVLVQYLIKESGIEQKLLDIASVKNETSETITQSLLRVLNRFSIQNKCIGFGADNTNTNFGSVQRNPGENIFTKLKEVFGRDIAGIGCGDHVLNNALHYSFEFLYVDIDSIIFKIHKYFAIYTVRVESLKQFCEESEVHFKTLHSKTRFLSIFPGLERILQLYEPLKEFFLSLPNPQSVLKAFFENPLSEAALHFAHSLAFVFHCSAAKMETQKGSLLETINIIESVKKTLVGRMSGRFIPFSVRKILAQHAHLQTDCEELKVKLLEMYSNASIYLNTWTVQYEEFKVFMWMALSEVPNFEDVQICISYLHGKSVNIRDDIWFDQFCFLKQFVLENQNNENFKKKLTHEKWVIFFKYCSSVEQYSEFLKIAQYFFAIPAHNATVERIFSLINAQWTDERNRLLTESIRNITLIKFNFNFDCFEFFGMIKSKLDV